MFEQMKTYCFGRFLIDVPRDAELKYHNNDYAVAKINSEIDVRKYDTLVKETLEKRKDEQGKRAFRFVRTEYPEGGDRQIIISKADLYGKNSYGVDAFTLNPRYTLGNGYFFYISSDAHSEKNLDNILNKYRAILNNVRYRHDSEIPKEAGFCFQDGFVANDGKTSQHETAMLSFRLKNHPDVWFKIRSVVLHVKEETLLERSKEVRSFLKERIQIISAKARETNGINGEELLAAFLAEDQTGERYIFMWETLGEIGNPLNPDVKLEIHTGDPNPHQEKTASSLTKQQALALYEAIVKSIRLRPVKESNLEPTQPDGSALETEPKHEPEAKAKAPDAFPRKLATGETCPKTGPWRCVEDGQTHNFTEGQRMPTAYFYKPATGLLDRIKGVKEVFSHTGPGHWEWVGDAPTTAAM